MRICLAFVAVLPCCAQSLALNSAALDPSLFRVTTFAEGLGYVQSIQPLPDGSLAVLSSPTFGGPSSILRFTEQGSTGVASGPGTPIYNSPSGPLTNLVRMGDYYVAGNLGNETITFLKPAANPAAPMTAVADFRLVFLPGWVHNTLGLAARPTPGLPGFFDLVFNVGSRLNDQATTAKVGLESGLIGIAGLAQTQLDADSLYAMRIDARAVPVFAQLTRIASGIRNVDGMGFQPVTGDFYFADNAMDGPGADGDEPPQADELNRIAAGEFGQLINFGFPTCYIQYRTGVEIGTGCRQPVKTFQPIPFPLGFESEGPAEMAFAPPAFPAGFNHGIYVGFAGKFISGTANEENAVVFHNFSTAENLHFSESGQAGVGLPTGLFSTRDALFISDLFTGKIYKITAAQPQPATPALSLGGVVHAATYGPRIAPGSFVASFGVNLSNGLTDVGTPPLQLSLDGVEVHVRGAKVPVHFISDAQTNFYVPLETALGDATITVKTPAGESGPQSVSLVQYAPGIFPLAGNYGAILNAGTADTTELHPAARDGFVEIYCTGLGPVDNELRAGTPLVTIGGVAAEVTYSGMPFIPGLYQVNVRIPRTVASGAQALTLAIGGVSSNAVLIGIGAN